MRVLCLLVLFVPVLPAQDAQQIIRKAVALAEQNWERSKDYTYLQRMERTIVDKGKVRDREVETYEFSRIYGQPYRRLVKRNDKPLSPKDERKEEEKMMKVLREREKENSAERRDRLSKYEKERREIMSFLQEIPEAFDFKHVGDEVVDGRGVWILEATPRPGYKPRSSRTKFLPKMKGRLWIDKLEYQWVRMQAEILDTISLGLVLVRLSPGTRINFAQTRVNNEVWLPRQANIHFDGRVALFKRFSGDIINTYSNYRKFATESQIISVGEAR